MFPEQIFVSAGFVVEAIKLGDRNDFEKVFITDFIFHQEHDLVAPPVFSGVVFAPEVFGDPHLSPENRFDAFFLGSDIKLDRRIQGRRVGNREARHPEFLGAFKQGVGRGESREEGIVRMDVEMGKHSMEYWV